MRRPGDPEAYLRQVFTLIAERPGVNRHPDSTCFGSDLASRIGRASQRR